MFFLRGSDVYIAGTPFWPRCWTGCGPRATATCTWGWSGRRGAAGSGHPGLPARRTSRLPSCASCTSGRPPVLERAETGGILKCGQSFRFFTKHPPRLLMQPFFFLDHVIRSCPAITLNCNNLRILRAKPTKGSRHAPVED